MIRSARFTLFAIIASFALVLGACGGDEAMSESEFVEKFMAIATDGMPSDQAEAMNDTIEEYASCIYDAIKDDADLVNSIDDVESTDEALPAEIEAKTGDCQADAEASISEDLGVDALDG